MSSTTVKRIYHEIIIDRFEGNFVVSEKEDRQMLDIEKSKILSVAKEGDILYITNDIITINFDEIEKRKKDRGTN
jgi:hypothetical protein